MIALGLAVRTGGRPVWAAVLTAAVAATAYATDWEPFTFTEASLTVAGTSVGTVRSVSLSGNNAIERRMRLGSATSKEPLEIGLRDYSGTITTDFDDLTNYGLFTAGTVPGTYTATVRAESGGRSATATVSSVTVRLMTMASPNDASPSTLR